MSGTPKQRSHERDVVLGVAPWKLNGTLTVPHGTAAMPAVLLVGDAGPLDRDSTIGPNTPLRDLARGLAARGIVVLRHDKRTFAYRTTPQLDALRDHITIDDDIVADVLSALAVLADQPEVDPARLIVAGHGAGGYLVPRIAQQTSTAAGFAILAANSRAPEDVLVDQLGYLSTLSGDIGQRAHDLLGHAVDLRTRLSVELDPTTPRDELLGIPATLWADVQHYFVTDAAAALDRPVFLAHPEHDFQVTAADLAQWSAALGASTEATIHRYLINHLLHTTAALGAPADYLEPGTVAAELMDDLTTWALSIGPLRKPKERAQATTHTTT